MTRRSFVVTGTDTNVGKTVFSAALAGALGASYWKPIQSGLAGETDSAAVGRLAEMPADRILPEAYRLATPVSPHAAAAIDRMRIDANALVPPAVDTHLVIEGAGGLLVPLNERLLAADVFARWQLPVILCARTTLGAINHALLSVEALAARQIPLLGIAFVGDAVPDTQAAIATFSGAKILGRLPILDSLTPASLRAAFAAGFELADFGA